MNVKYISSFLTAGTLLYSAMGDNFGSGTNQFTIDFVDIGYPANSTDISGYGSVDYSYRIGTYEVTIDQVIKAQQEDGNIVNGQEDYWNSGSFSLGTNAPAVWLDWSECCRFCNFLTSGDSSFGAYTVSNGNVIALDRESALLNYETVYVISNEDEWYKAAYFKSDGSGYSIYANGTATAPVMTTDANYNGAYNGSTIPGFFTPWGVGSGSVEQNGTFDMMGNVWERFESPYAGGSCRSGTYTSPDTYLQSSYRRTIAPNSTEKSFGMRVVALEGTVQLPVVPSVSIKNISVSQREGSKLVDIYYDLSSDNTNAVTIALAITNAGSAVVATSLSGDVGAGIGTGSVKHVVWDAGVDWGGNVAMLEYTIYAPDASAGASVPAPVARTGQSASYQSGDDGDLKAGTAWPVPRFSDNGDGTVTDNLTQLEWVKAPHALPGNASTMTWSNAVVFCEGLSYATHLDWRLPSCRELRSVLDYEHVNPALPSAHPFIGILNGFYWTSTARADVLNQAWRVYVGDGTFISSNKSNGYSVWLVRGQSANPGAVARTGQTTSYQSGDDGDLQTGVEWPNPRFLDVGNGVVSDLLTGLDWVKEPHSLAGNATTMPWSNAVALCEGLVFAGHSNWRLPNINELESLVHYGEGSWGDQPYEWLNSSETPFSGILSFPNYWSGTSFATLSSYAWYTSMFNGQESPSSKTAFSHAWPVRSGSDEPANQSTTFALVDSRDYSLSVSSLYGTPLPFVGIHSNYCWKSTVTASVDTAVSAGGTNYSCSGWTGSGVLPLLGSGTNVVLTLNQTASSIDWKWIEDLDLDRIPDDWELLYYGSETGAVAGVDTDGDGYNAWAEYILGSNPTNSGSSFLFTPSSSQPTNTAFSVDFTTVTGRLYAVECTDELGSGNWQVLTNFIGDGSAMQIIDPANIPACFYQIRIDWVD